MVGIKNVNEMKEKITKKIMNLVGDLEKIQDLITATEILMYLTKFQWKFVLKDLLSLKNFKN